MGLALNIRRLAGLAGLASIAALAASAESNLLENSPFAPTGTGAPAATQPAPLELRGIVRTGSEYEFSLYDPAKRESVWVTLNESGHDFVVKTYDAARDTIFVDQGGRGYALVLKDARITPLVRGTTPQTAAASPATASNQAARELTPEQLRILDTLRKEKRQRETAALRAGRSMDSTE